MSLPKADWRRIGLLAMLAGGGVLTLLNIVALASGEDREAGLMELLARCKSPPAAAATVEKPAAATKPATQPTPHPRSRGDASPGRVTQARPGGAAGPKPKPAPKPKSAQGEQAARITKRNVFSPPRAKPKFVAVLIGVLGDQAIFQGGKMLKVGQSIAGAKLTQIGPDWAELVFEGKPRRVDIYSAKASGSGPSGRPTRRGGPPPMPSGPMPSGPVAAKGAKPPTSATVTVSPPSMSFRGLVPGGKAVKIHSIGSGGGSSGVIVVDENDEDNSSSGRR